MNTVEELADEFARLALKGLAAKGYVVVKREDLEALMALYVGSARNIHNAKKCDDAWERCRDALEDMKRC